MSHVSEGLTLYSYWRSSTSYRVRIALALKGLDYALKPINLLKAEQRSESYLAVNPMGAVPSLQLESGAIIIESPAILEYLEEAYPTPALLPENREARAYVRALMNIVACNIHPVNNLRILNYLSDEFDVETEARTRWMHRWFADGFAAMEALIVRSGVAGACCYGDMPGMADLCLVPQLYNARRFHVPLEAYPNLVRIADYCETLPPFQEAHPDNQPDAAP